MKRIRMFQSMAVYEICFRAKRGLPLPARQLIKLVIESALARTQRQGGKVRVCNYVWMGNHPHILVVSQDVTELKNFYGELKKRITDMLKRLLGMDELKLWEDKEARVIQLLDLDEVKKKIGYYFLNPARAGLVESIEHYPGANTWKTFCSAEPSVSAAVETTTPWIRLPSIPALSSIMPSMREEAAIINQLKGVNKTKCTLKVEPFAWLKVFGITSAEEIEAIRQEIVQKVYDTELELKEQRIRERKPPVIGDIRLALGAITTQGHKPSKNGTIVYFLSTLSELRVRFMRCMKLSVSAVANATAERVSENAGWNGPRERLCPQYHRW